MRSHDDEIATFSKSAVSMMARVGVLMLDLELVSAGDTCCLCCGGDGAKSFLRILLGPVLCALSQRGLSIICVSVVNV